MPFAFQKRRTFGHFLPHRGVLPVQVGLRDVVTGADTICPEHGTYSQAGPPNLDTQLVGNVSGVPSLKM